MKLISANKLNRLWNNGVVAKMVAKTKILKTLEEIEANTNEENVAGATALKEVNNKLQQSFQAGCDTIVAGCTTYGSTPRSNSPSDIVNAINAIYTNRYNSGYSSGRIQGQNDVKSNPGAYGVTKSFSVGLHMESHAYTTTGYVYINGVLVLTLDCRNPGDDSTKTADHTVYASA